MNRMQLGSRLVALVVLAVGLLSLASGVVAGPTVSDLTPEQARAVTGGATALTCVAPGTANCGQVNKTCGNTECEKHYDAGNNPYWTCPSTAEEDKVASPYNSTYQSSSGKKERKVTSKMNCRTVYKCSFAGASNYPACWYDPADTKTKCDPRVSTVVLRREDGVEVSEPSGDDCP